MASIEKIADTNLPIIFSTGGLDINNIDDLVIFTHRDCDFAIMHCVSLYPIQRALNLNQIEILKKRYPTK